MNIEANLAAKGMVSILNGTSDKLSQKLVSDAIAISANRDLKVQRKHFGTLSQKCL